MVVMIQIDFTLSFRTAGYYMRATCRWVKCNRGPVIYVATCCVMSSNGGVKWRGM